MKSLPARSPSRRSTPPPPASRMSHRSPGFRRGRSPERRRRVDSQGTAGSGTRVSPPKSRDHEFRTPPRSQPPDFPIPRRSRSPIRESKRRSFSPKRKSPVKRERERHEGDSERPPRTGIPRKRSRSKSPPVNVAPPLREGGSHMVPYSTPTEGPSQGHAYKGPGHFQSSALSMDVEHSARSMSSLGERFQGPGRRSYEDDNGRPVFRGPEGTKMEKIIVDIRRDLPVNKSHNVNRNVNPEDVMVPRRPDASHDEEEYSVEQRHVSRNRYSNDHKYASPNSRRNLSPWEQEEANHYNHRRNKSEGSHPIFAREEIRQASECSKDESGASYGHRSMPTDEHHRVVAIVNNPSQVISGASRYESPVRYSSGPSHAPAYYERERTGPPHDYGHPREYERSHGHTSGDDHIERREDVRQDLEVRRRDDSRYSGHGDGMRYDKGRDYRDSERGSSSLRMRITERRTERHDDHDSGHHHPMERHEIIERDRDRRHMMQSSPPGGDRRRGESYSHMGDPERKMRIPSGSHGPGRRNDIPDRYHQGSDFMPRPNRFHGPRPWEVNPEYVPKGRAYFEHDNRDEMMRIPNRGRGTMGPRGYIRGRGYMRGRPFRGSGPMRGFMSGRGPRRGGYSQRGFYNVY